MAENSGSVSCGSITGTGATFSENWLRANREKSRKGTKDTLGAEHILFSAIYFEFFLKVGKEQKILSVLNIYYCIPAIYFECGILLSSSSLMDVQKNKIWK